MTIADIANFSWVNWAEWAGVDVKPFKVLSQWVDRINDRPAVKRGLNVPEPFTMKEKLKSKVSRFELYSTAALTSGLGGRRGVCETPQSVGHERAGRRSEKARLRDQ